MPSDYQLRRRVSGDFSVLAERFTGPSRVITLPTPYFGEYFFVALLDIYKDND